MLVVRKKLLLLHPTAAAAAAVAAAAAAIAAAAAAAAVGAVGIFFALHAMDAPQGVHTPGKHSTGRRSRRALHN